MNIVFYCKERKPSEYRHTDLTVSNVLYRQILGSTYRRGKQRHIISHDGKSILAVPSMSCFHSKRLLDTLITFTRDSVSPVVSHGTSCETHQRFRSWFLSNRQCQLLELQRTLVPVQEKKWDKIQFSQMLCGTNCRRLRWYPRLRSSEPSSRLRLGIVKWRQSLERNLEE